MTYKRGTSSTVASTQPWMIAKRSLGQTQSSQTTLERLRFTEIKEDDDLFFSCQPPPGWTKSVEGYFTTIKDNSGRKRISQFSKIAYGDTEAFLSLCPMFTISQATVENGYLVCKILKNDQFVNSFSSREYDRTDPWSRENLRVKLDNECKDWLDTNFPEWKNPLAYWGD